MPHAPDQPARKAAEIVGEFSAAELRRLEEEVMDVTPGGQHGQSAAAAPANQVPPPPPPAQLIPTVADLDLGSIPAAGAPPVAPATPLPPAPPAAASLSPVAEVLRYPAEIDLDSIPAGTAAASPAAAPRETPTPPRAAARAPEQRAAPLEAVPEEASRTVVDSREYSSFDAYQIGKAGLRPLAPKDPLEAAKPKHVNQRPKFLDGKLPRSVERGVVHPLPGKLIATSFWLLMSKLFLFATVPLMLWFVVLGRESIGIFAWIPAGLFISGFFFLIGTQGARCKICSCQLFSHRFCSRNPKAHRLFGLGYAGSAALHLLLFKWMRCMYCGTAIRLRRGGNEDGMQRRR